MFYHRYKRQGLNLVIPNITPRDAGHLCCDVTVQGKPHDKRCTDVKVISKLLLLFYLLVHAICSMGGVGI